MVNEEGALAHVSYTEFRAGLAGYMDEVCDTRAPLTVTRQKGRSIVIMSEAEYEGMMETLHLLKSPANAARLMEGLTALGAGDAVEVDPTQ